MLFIPVMANLNCFAVITQVFRNHTDLLLNNHFLLITVMPLNIFVETEAGFFDE